MYSNPTDWLIDWLIVLGLVRDLTNSYPLCIHVQNVLILLCAIAWIIEYMIISRKHKDLEQNITWSIKSLFSLYVNKYQSRMFCRSRMKRRNITKKNWKKKLIDCDVSSESNVQ